MRNQGLNSWTIKNNLTFSFLKKKSHSSQANCAHHSRVWPERPKLKTSKSWSIKQ